MYHLYGTKTSPFVRHCRIAFAQEGIGYDLTHVDFATSGEQTPTKRVPFLKDNRGLFLTDSSAIILHARQSVGKTFLANSQEANIYFTANTALDTGINIFLMELNGVTDIPYMERQRQRLASCFAALEESIDPDAAMDDGLIRTGCLTSWVTFRDRFDFSSHEKLVALQKRIDADPVFRETAPPADAAPPKPQ